MRYYGIRLPNSMYCMAHNYTQNHLLLLYYREIDLFTRLEMEFAMEDDSTLAEAYHVLREDISRFPTCSFRPRKEITDQILAYSKI
jgi:hypothetical protein